MAINYKASLKQLGLIVLVVAIGTVFDWMAHSASIRFYVPLEYYVNKIIFGSFWGFVVFKVTRNYFQVPDPTRQAFWMSLAVAVMLQTKYFLQGYDLFFVFLFMFLHFVMFLAPALILFRKYRRLMED